MPPGNFLRGPAGHDGASAVPALGSHVDDVIGSLDDVEVVLDHDGGIAALDKFAQDTGQLGDVVKMEAGGGLVQDVDGPAGALAGELGGQLDALGFAAGKLGGGLAEFDIAQSDVVKGLDLAADGRYVLKEGQGFLDGHLKYVGDVFALVADLQGLAVVALAVADLAGDVDVRQEMHLDLDDAVAGAGFAAAALDVKGKAAFGVAPGAGVLGAGKEGPDQVKDAGIGRGIGPGSAADGGLVDVDDLVQLLDSLDIVMLSGDGPGTVEVTGQAFVEDLVDQGALAGSGYAGHDREHTRKGTGRLWIPGRP